ncbi:MAG: MFS transporter [Bacteroidales bacterium]|nr:MFS transporter [Bacteroidales bacterium]MCF8332877.1 MFS transporter [Bacteroidales bacterium]
MKSKPQLTFWQIWNMNFGFLGIQFGYALQNANVSRIFETLGADIENIPILWIAAPVTGLIVQPIIGHYSDKTWTRLGRRRPYFLIGAILASLALIVMPNSPTLWVAAGMLWIMDASINISQEPFRAFVGDLLPEKQRTRGFTMQSFFIGIGAVVASALPWMLTNWFGVSNTAPEGVIPDSVKFAFYLGAAAFFGAVAWTVFSTKEYSPEELKEFDAAEEEEEEQKQTKREETTETTSLENLKKRSRVLGLSLTIFGLATTLLVYLNNYMWELYILTIGISLFGILELVVLAMQKHEKSKSGLAEIINDFNMMPLAMRQLAVVQFFSWFALFALWIYSVAGITSHIYDMKMDKEVVHELQSAIKNSDRPEEADKTKSIGEELQKYNKKLQSGQEEVVARMKVIKFFADEERSEEMQLSQNARNTVDRIQQEYNEGGNWVGVGFAVYNGFAAVFAFLLVWLAKVTNRKMTHLIALAVGGVSMISIYFINSTGIGLLVPFVGIGLTWASILAMPYAILTSSLPSHKMGVYMGIFNFFIVIPQILAASVLGFAVKSLFNEQPIYALVLGGVTWFVAAAMMPFVKDKIETKTAD